MTHISIDGIFAGITALVHGRKRSPQINKAITSNGGIMVQQYTDDVTHIIIGQTKPNPKTLQSGNAAVVTAKWITDCVSSSQLLPIETYLVFPNESSNRKRRFEMLSTCQGNENPVSVFLLHVAHTKSPIPIPAGLKREHLNVAKQIRESKTAINKNDAIHYITGPVRTIEQTLWDLQCQEANKQCCDGIQKFLCDIGCALDVPNDSFPITHFRSCVADRAADVTAPDAPDNIKVVSMMEFSESPMVKVFACSNKQRPPLVEPITRSVLWYPKIDDVFLFKSTSQSEVFNNRLKSLPFDEVEDIARANIRIMWIPIKKYSLLATLQRGIQTPEIAYASPLKAIEGMIDESSVILLLVSVLTLDHVPDRSVAVPSMSLLKFQLSEIQHEDIKSESQQARIAHLEKVIKEVTPSPFAAGHSSEDKTFSSLTPIPSLVIKDPSSVLIHYIYSIKPEVQW